MSDRSAEEALLVALNLRWSNHKYIVKYLSKVIFAYLDRYYVTRENKPNTQDVGTEAFRDEVFVVVKDTVTTAILNMIENDRNGHNVEMDVVKDSVAVYVARGMGRSDVYVSEFEEPFLRVTKA